jgi:DUF4097 and DUF4098 domain-containing protein YvlB
MAFPVAAADQTFERSLTVAGAVTLSVSTGSGDITVRAGSDGAVRIVGSVRPSSSWGAGAQDAESAVRAVLNAPPIVQNGNTVEIGKITDQDVARRVSVSYEVTVPKATTLSANSGSGDIAVADLTGGVSARSGSGDVRVGRIDGPVSAKVGSGDVSIAATHGQAEVATGSGDVSIEDAAGPVSVKTGSGDVRVRQSASGALDVSSGSGDIVAQGVAGPVRVHSASGEVSLSGRPSADWDVNTASADIVIDIPEGTGFRVSASTLSGAIRNEHGASTAHSGKSYDGTVGSGGPLVHVKTTSGTVVIRKGTGR